MLSLALLLPTFLPPQQPLPPREVRRALEQKFAKSERKLAQLAETVTEAVDARLTEGTWTSGAGDGRARTLREHPGQVLLAELVDAARTKAAQKKIPADVRAVLERFEWPSRLELDRGLDGGSDRPVPKNQQGFIVLGACEELFPGYPVYSPNRYVFGTHELAGWKTGVKPGKKPSYKGRGAKDVPVVVSELPPWMTIDVYLHGGSPDCVLFALPELTHRIHARLAERRRAGGEELAALDQALAFFDGRMNGFVFDAPFEKDPVAVAVPFHDVFTDDQGLFTHFPPSEHLVAVGDMPFAATHSYVEYAKTFLGGDVTTSDFIGQTARGREVATTFRAAGAAAANYRRLLDVIARAVLCPDVAYPATLGLYDTYRDGEPPRTRASEPATDFARRYALVLWAYADKDPVALADWLYDHLLSRPELVFPSQESLLNAFLVTMREQESGLLAELSARIAEGGEERADFEREFSMGATYLQRSLAPGGQALADSYRQFHAQWFEPVRQAAYAAVQEGAGL